MEANNFIAKLKANGVESDKYDLAKSFKEYMEILRNLSAKDKNSFSLNVLCILCRNLEKVSAWRERIDNKDLLRLSIECVRHTRTLEGPEQVKTLACIYHLHKHVVKHSSSLPPELVLKLSFMPFEYEADKLLKEYCKTYWSILVDRLTYIEKLKAKRMPIFKLLPKLIEDVIQVIKIYDTVQFCNNMLIFLIKKLHFIYSDSSAKELNEAFGTIFECISKKDLKLFKSLSEKEAIDLYVKLNDCLYIITENALKNKSKESVLDAVTRVCITLLGHRSDMFHCLQTFYLNSFCYIFREKTDINLLENIFNSLLMSCEMTEKLGYKNIIFATYPFISQLLRLFIENNVIDANENKFNESIIDNCLKLILFLLQKFKKSNQLLKCENCTVKSGLHDGLRLSFHIKHFITISTNQKVNLRNILPTYYELVEQQYIIINELKTLGCVNQEKCLRKLQTDIHNTAITLNKAQCYEYSIKLFEIYLQNEIKNIKNDIELKNISRALYNKSICELEFKLYEESLKNAYLSLIFSLPEGLSSDKYMSLVMDIKAKALKCVTEDGDSDDNGMQMISVLETCKLLYDDNSYGNLKPFMTNLKFSVLLKHEFSMYVKLWPSIVPIAGVWKSLYDMVYEKHQWIKVENKETLLWTLFEVVLETPTAVRTIHDGSYKTIVKQLLGYFEISPPKPVQEKIVYATVLFLQAEYDIADASQKYGWKILEHTVDPDQAEVVRTVEQEHRAISLAHEAVHLLTAVLPSLKTMKDANPSSIFHNALQVYQVFVQQLLFFQRVIYGLQLAYICCQFANLLGDKEAYVRNAGVLVYHASSKRKQLDDMISTSTKYTSDLMKNNHTLDTALNFLCELSIYYTKIGSVGVAGKLLRSVQSRLLRAQTDHPDINLQLSVGRLFEAQAMLSPDSGLSALSAANGLQRHYLALSSTSSRWSTRRLWSQCACARLRAASAGACVCARSLRVLRRAAAAASPALARCAALPCALLYAAITDTNRSDDAQIKIDNRLKYILGLKSSSDIAIEHAQTPKREHFTPKQTNLESMLDSMFKKTQVSPSLPCITIPAFQTPEFLKHAQTCTCHACVIPECTVIACLVCSLEASMYYRAKEFDIAKNYYNGASKVFALAENKLKYIFEGYKKKFNETVVEISKELIDNHFRNVQLEFLIELALFEMSRCDFEKSDDIVIRIHELLSDVKIIDKYIQNEIHNLMIASAQIRKTTKPPKETGLENDFENLKLSPVIEPQKTPDTKISIPKTDTAIIVKDDEIPKKRKVIKLNFDDANLETEEKVPKPKKHQFKIPVPVTSKPILEKMTPRTTRSRPDIRIQQPSLDQEIFTPKSEENSQFFTPCQSTPAEQFFTPMTSMKTYSRRIVKNLETEFSTPKGKENSQKAEKPRRSKVETGSVQAIRDKRTLKRATSPGKLVEEKPARPRRVRQPILTDEK